MSEWLIHDVVFDNTKHISPGIVGVVGDPNDGVRLVVDNQMNPPVRWGRQGPHNSANIQDGSVVHINGESFYGGPGDVNNMKWPGNRSHMTAYGWSRDDMGTGLDTPVIPWQLSQGPTGWNDMVGDNNATLQSGSRWGPGPPPFALPPGHLTRGGLYPRVTQRNMGDPPPQTSTGPGVYNQAKQSFALDAASFETTGHANPGTANQAFRDAQTGATQSRINLKNRVDSFTSTLESYNQAQRFADRIFRR